MVKKLKCEKCKSLVFVLKAKKETKKGVYCDLNCSACGAKLDLTEWRDCKIKIDLAQNILRKKTKFTKKCPKCQIDLEKIKPIKHGFRHARGIKIQRYSCKRCGYKFEKCGLTYRMRNPRWKILKAIELRNKGLSYAVIADELGGISRQTILRWLRNRRRKKNKLVNFTRTIPSFKRIMNKKTITQSAHKRTFKIEI